MYTITRKLAVVCLAVVFSVLVYGCGGGSKEQALTEDVSINVDMVTAGLATPGTYTIQPGEAADAGDATFTCAAEGPTCEVTVAADGTATSVGGMATAMNSAAADARLADEAEAKRVADEAEAKRVADEEAARLAVITMLEEAIARLENAEAERIAAMEAAAKLAADEAAAKLAADEEAARLAAVKKLEDEIAMLKAAEAERLAAIAAEAERIAEAARVAAAALAEEERIAAAALAEIARIAAEEKKIADEVARILAVINPVDITPPPGLTILAGMYTIQPGETEDAGIVAFTCSAEGVRCLVTVADDGTVTSAGGAATAMITAEGYRRLYQSKIVDTGKLATGYKTITPGNYPIEPGQSMDVADATFTCPVGGVRCDVTVADDGTVTSVGGTATAKNSNAVKYTMTAIALSEALNHSRSRGSGYNGV